MWLAGMAMQASREDHLMDQLRAKHHRIMRFRKKFMEIFGIDVKRFYKEIYEGFDIIAFDDFFATSAFKNNSTSCDKVA